MIDDKLFDPGNTARLTAGTNSISVTWTDADSIDAESVLFHNEGSQTVFWGKGIGSANAYVPTSTPVQGSTPVMAGAIEIYYKGKGTDTIACIVASSTCLISITPGHGV